MNGVETRTGGDPFGAHEWKFNFLASAELRDACRRLLGSEIVQSTTDIPIAFIRTADGSDVVLVSDRSTGEKVLVGVKAMPTGMAGQPGKDVRDPNPPPGGWDYPDTDEFQLFNCWVTSVNPTWP